jgi:plasmid maintenance system antidote protein VapI
MKNITQHKIAKTLKVSQPFISQVMTRQAPISWLMAEKLSDLFPGKSLRDWKKANPKEVIKAFNSIKK